MSKPTAQLVIADDDATIRQLVTLHAEKGGFTVAAAENGKDALELVGEETEVVLLDLRMPVMDGFGFLEQLGAEWPGLPAVVLSSEEDIGEAVRTMKYGAMDFLRKPVDPAELLAVLRNGRRLRRAERENEGLAEALGGAGPVRQITAGSDAMREVLALAGKAAALDSPVLLLGESGVGKHSLARYIHAQSARANGRLVTVNCEGQTRDMLAAELFGNEKGAFEGAMRRRTGKVEAGRGGSLLIDGVDELPISLQGRIEKFLANGRFRRVGGTESLTSDVRVIALADSGLEQKVGGGLVKEGLFDRLNVFPITIPPLRERLEELEALVAEILPGVIKASGGRKVSLSKEALRVLQAYDWPGNIRQLETVLERSVALCEGERIEVADLPETVRGSTPDARIPAGLGGIPLVDLEREALLQTLKLCRGNKSESARRLGVTEKSIYNKLKRLGLM